MDACTFIDTTITGLNIPIRPYNLAAYQGAVYFGLITDKKNVPDPDAIIERFRPEMEKLLLIALMEDWERTPQPASAEQLLKDRHGPKRAKRRTRKSA